MKRIEKEQAQALLEIGEKRNWPETIRCMKMILEGQLQPLDPEIFSSLVQLTKMGLETLASCAGHRTRRCRCLPPREGRSRSFYTGYINFIPHLPYFTDNLASALMHQGIIPIAYDVFLDNTLLGIGISYYQEEDNRAAIRLSWSFEKYKELKAWWKRMELTFKAIEVAVDTKGHPLWEIDGVPVRDLVSVVRLEG